MKTEKVQTLVVGGGQAGLAMSEHLSDDGLPHVVLERHRIAERWRSERWDSLVANGPAWHDRFPTKEFANFDPDGFPSKDNVADYFEAFAKQINAPIRCGVNVLNVSKHKQGTAFRVETSEGVIDADNVVVATGPFQRPIIPPVIPESAGVTQIHSNSYKNPAQLADGAVLVVGAGSSGSQIADELLRDGRSVYLSVGPHDRPPRSYRSKDFVWWLGVLGKWEAKTIDPSTAHVTIAVSGAYGGHTIDFRRFAERGMTLVGMTEKFDQGVLTFAPDLAQNINQGDANYLSILGEADEYVAKNNIDLPEEPEARIIGPDPQCMTDPLLALDLQDAGVNTIVWATGYEQDFGWLDVDVLDDRGVPRHKRGVSVEPGIYFLGLPWLSMRGSSFIWGVWEDARYLAKQIAERSR